MYRLNFAIWWNFNTAYSLLPSQPKDNSWNSFYLRWIFIFRWNKKLEREGLAKAEDHEIDRIQRKQRYEQRLELEKVKQRRLEREREREERTQLMELEQRDRYNEKFMKWEKDEDDFHLKQARLRSKIRIIDGRAKPIDLVRNINSLMHYYMFLCNLWCARFHSKEKHLWM